MAKKLLLCLLLSASSAVLSAQNLALKTNLLYDATLTPSLGFELPLSARHWSVGLNAGYRPWPTDEQSMRKYRHLMVSPYARLWADSLYRHSFFSLYAVYSHYNVADVRFPFGLYKAVRDSRRQGDLGALGLSYGYNWPLSARWHLEAEAGAALAFTHYEEFACGHCGKKRGSDSRLFVLPKLALNLVYNIGPKPKSVEQPEEEPLPLLPVETDTLPQPDTQMAEAVPVQPRERFIDSLMRQNPILTHIADYRPYDRGRALSREKGALFVYFPTSKSEIVMDYRDNRATLERIVSITRKVMADDQSLLCKIQIVGLASIDGPRAANERISAERAQMLKQYLQDTLRLPDDKFEVNAGGEAWAEMREQLADAGMQEALNVFYSELDLDRREQRLRRLQQGRVWEQLKQQILVDQRNAGYMRVYFDYADNPADEQ